MKNIYMGTYCHCGSPVVLPMYLWTAHQSFGHILHCTLKIMNKPPLVHKLPLNTNQPQHLHGFLIVADVLERELFSQNMYGVVCISSSQCI